MSWRPSSLRRNTWLARLPAWARMPLRWGVVVAAVVVVAALLVALVYGGLALRFDLGQVASMPARTVICDRHGTELDAGIGVKRRIITREMIPPFLVDALLAREDARFRDHHGIDVRGLARATLRNLRDRSFTQGASTLTMQLARNTFDMRAKSLHRKLLEIALTLRIEMRFSKDEILVHYLNRIYFGAGCHGIEEAAQTYFGRATSALDPGECALLVGIIRGPHMFSPFRNLDGALEERDQVLDRMVAAGFLDDGGAAAVRAAPIQLVPAEARQPERSYALQNVRAELDLILTAHDDIGDGGLRVETTLDSPWQIRLEEELFEAVRQLERTAGWAHPTHSAHQPGTRPGYLQFAAVTLDTRTGAILALVGGRDFLDSRFDRTSGARRDLGGIFEPFVAAAAAERGKLVLPGKPVQTGRLVGPAGVERIARRCGIGGPFDATDDLFRGDASATPLELATALATLGNDGRRPKPFLVRSIRDRAGRALYEATPQHSPALSRDAARESLAGFHATKQVRITHGTSLSRHDAWLLRLGPSGSTAVWFGFDQPQPIAPRAALEAFLTRLAARLAAL